MELAGNFSAHLEIGKWGELNLPNHPIPVKLTHSFTIVQSIRKNDKDGVRWGGAETYSTRVTRVFFGVLHRFFKSKLTFEHF